MQVIINMCLSVRVLKQEWASFSFINIFCKVELGENCSMMSPMGFKLWPSGVGINCSTNLADTSTRQEVALVTKPGRKPLCFQS